MWIERRLISSRAFAALRTATAHRVLAVFWTKRKMSKTGRRGRERWDITNNDEITFTYREAKRMEISTTAFRNAVDELRDKGFLDIAEGGAGLYRSTNKYTLSNRWRNYGTPDYEPPRPRPKASVSIGFKKGNRHGRNCKKTDSTVTGQHGSTVTGQHG